MLRKLLYVLSVIFMLLMFLLAVAAVIQGEFRVAVSFGVVFIAWWVVKEVLEARSRSKARRAYQRWLNDPNVPHEQKQQEIERRRRHFRRTLAEDEYYGRI